MQTPLTLQSTLAFVGGIAGGALVTLGSAVAVNSLLLTASPMNAKACVMTIPAEGANSSSLPRQSPGCGIQAF